MFRLSSFVAFMQALFWGIEVKINNLILRLAETIKGGVLPVYRVGQNQNIPMGVSEYGGRNDG